MFAARGTCTIAPPSCTRSGLALTTQQQQWFDERHDYAGSSIGFRVNQRLHAEQTPFQSIEIWDTTDWGKLMVIDGCTMVTTRDNFLYHEMMSHPALFTHPRARRVVIIGGGDCGTLREVLKHDEVESAIQVEIDERVTRLAEQYFPELCESNNDPRAQLLFIDGIKWMAECEAESLDIVIVDSTDPIGLYTKLAEDEHGLYCEGLLLKDEVQRAREVHALMKRRVITGLSIGYWVRESSFDEKNL